MNTNSEAFIGDLEIVLILLHNFLADKNKKYGDSALQPINCFSNLDPIEGINIRIDDKIKRLINQAPGEDEDAEYDLLGYLVIKQIAKLREKEKSNAAT